MDPSATTPDATNGDSVGFPPAHSFAATGGDTSFPNPNIETSNAKPSDSSDDDKKEDDQASTSTVVASGSSSGGSGRRRRVLMIMIALFLMIAGIVSGTILLQRRSFEQSFAWDCELYKFDVNDQGVVSAINGSPRNLPSQQANVYINDQLAATFDVPALDAGQGAELGVVTIPSDPNFTWRVEGTKECKTSGEFAPNKVAQCLNIKAFDENWNPLTLTDLSQLSAGDVVRFTVGGTTNSGTFDSARFTINGEQMDPVTDKRPNTDEFYYEYTIPTKTTSFEINAELMHSEAGWI